MFLAKHAIADEIERLMAVLDALDCDDDLEMNAANYYDDPRLDDAEGMMVSSIGSGSLMGDEDSDRRSAPVLPTRAIGPSVIHGI